MANLPENVIHRASVKAAELEQTKAGHGEESKCESAMDVDEDQTPVNAGCHGDWMETFCQLQERLTSMPQCSESGEPKQQDVEGIKALLADAQATASGCVS